MDYNAELDRAIQRLHDEGRYRTFIDIGPVPESDLDKGRRDREGHHRLVRQ